VEEDEDAHAAGVAAALARSVPMQQSRDLDPAMVGLGATGDHWGMVEEFEHRTINRTLGVQDNQAGEITTLVYSREIARYKRNFKEAGKLKKRLKELGVRVDDKEKMWHSSDGTSGFVPPYALLNLGDDHFNPYY
jgi:cysteinyl-tRNA synthetase